MRTFSIPLIQVRATCIVFNLSVQVYTYIFRRECPQLAGHSLDDTFISVNDIGRDEVLFQVHCIYVSVKHVFSFLFYKKAPPHPLDHALNSTLETGPRYDY